MRRIGHLIRKELLQLVRTRSMMAITFGMPVIQLLILGFAISGDVIDVPTVITDLDNSQSSRGLAGRLENTRYLDIRHKSASTDEARTLLTRGDVILSVVIPEHFERDIIRGENPAIFITADAQNTNTAVTGVSYIRRIIQSWAAAGGLPKGAPRPKTFFNSVEINTRVWYNQDMKTVLYMVPGIIILLVSIITILLTGMAIVREREAGTLEQLMVSPVTRVELILGKTIPFALLGVFELTLALVIAKIVYSIQIAGSLPLFFGIAIIYVFCTLGLGMLISTIAHTQQQALFLAWFILVVFIMLSGFFLPLENMPKAAYYFTFIDPFRYMMYIVRQLFLKGVGIAELWPHVAAMGFLAFLVNTAAVIRFNKHLD